MRLGGIDGSQSILIRLTSRLNEPPLHKISSAALPDPRVIKPVGHLKPVSLPPYCPSPPVAEKWNQFSYLLVHAPPPLGIDSRGMLLSCYTRRSHGKKCKIASFSPTRSARDPLRGTSPGPLDGENFFLKLIFFASYQSHPTAYLF